MYHKNIVISFDQTKKTYAYRSNFRYQRTTEVDYLHLDAPVTRCGSWTAYISHHILINVMYMFSYQVRGEVTLPRTDGDPSIQRPLVYPWFFHHVTCALGRAGCHCGWLCGHLVANHEFDKNDEQKNRFEKVITSDGPLRIGLWDPFEMAFSWLANGGY